VRGKGSWHIPADNWGSSHRQQCTKQAGAYANNRGFNRQLKRNVESRRSECSPYTQFPFFTQEGWKQQAYQQQLQSAGFVVSMSRKGMPYDNAVMESFFSSLKLELTHHESFADLDAARTKIFHYIEVFYNRQRLHSSLDYHSPDTFERVHRAP
jgi:putative transposase